VLEVDAVGVRFGGLAALHDVSFAVGSGEIVSVIGPNGAGKTTLFHVVTGYRRPSAGEVRYKGERITGLAPNAIARRGIVRTFQKTEVFPQLGLVECVRLGALCRRHFGVIDVLLRPAAGALFAADATKRARELLDFVGLAAKAESKARALSYGEQRLLEIAVGLAATPEILLLDEPASGMNPEESDRMEAIIRRIRDLGVAVVLIEHNMRLVMSVSDRIVVLHHGERIAEGTPDAVAGNRAVVEAYLGRGWADAAA
jgi:branched-chain amino acid transport system ATP-binding protein